MDRIPFRVCRMCRVELAPGEPYWVHHAGPFVGQLMYCEQCMMPVNRTVKREVVRTLNRRNRRLQRIAAEAATPREVKPERSEP